MTNYIKLNGKKIELNDAQVEEIKRSFGIGEKKLSEIPVGGTFKIGDYEFAVLEHLEDSAVVIKKEIYGSEICFGNNNNYDGSDVDKLCNKFGEKIAKIIGSDNMLEFILDLTANDGMKCYGSIKRKMALRTADMQRKYAYIFDKLPKCWEWTATAFSTPKHENSTGVECVSPLGFIRYGDSDYDNIGVRPAIPKKRYVSLWSIPQDAATLPIRGTLTDSI